MGQFSREGTENDKWYCILAWIQSLQIQRSVRAKKYRHHWKNGKLLTYGTCGTHVHVYTHKACFQINLKGYLALSYHCLQFYLTRHSLQVRHWYLSIAILFLGFV